MQIDEAFVDAQAPNAAAIKNARGVVLKRKLAGLFRSADGTLLWNKTPVDRATMDGYISSEATKDPQPEVHITVDKFAKYEIVAQTLADLQHRGLKKIGFVNNDYF